MQTARKIMSRIRADCQENKRELMKFLWSLSKGKRSEYVPRSRLAEPDPLEPQQFWRVQVVITIAIWAQAPMPQS